MNKLLWGLMSLLVCVSVQANCPVMQVGELAQVAHVYDGDSLRLEDGRRIRVLGINAPEVKGQNSTAEPLSDDARRAALAFLGSDTQVRLIYDQQQRDRYGRYLAHVFNTKGESLAASLLREGMAFHIAVPPNLDSAECLGRKQELARAASLGVWATPYWAARKAADLNLTDTGFLRVQGRVMKVTEGRDIWLELDGPLVIKIASGDKHYFNGAPWRSWQGKTLEVRGWVVNRSTPETTKKGFKPLQVQLRSSYALTLYSKGSN